MPLKSAIRTSDLISSVAKRPRPFTEDSFTIYISKGTEYYNVARRQRGIFSLNILYPYNTECHLI